MELVWSGYGRRMEQMRIAYMHAMMHSVPQANGCVPIIGPSPRPFFSSKADSC